MLSRIVGEGAWVHADPRARVFEQTRRFGNGDAGTGDQEGAAGASELAKAYDGTGEPAIRRGNATEWAGGLAHGRCGQGYTERRSPAGVGEGAFVLQDDERAGPGPDQRDLRPALKRWAAGSRAGVYEDEHQPQAIVWPLLVEKICMLGHFAEALARVLREAGFNDVQGETIRTCYKSMVPSWPIMPRIDAQRFPFITVLTIFVLRFDDKAASP